MRENIMSSKRKLLEEINELRGELRDSKDAANAFYEKWSTEMRAGAALHDAKIKLAEDIVKIQSDYTKKIKEVERLEKANKKFMQAIDALKKQLADREIDRDYVARETALRLAIATNSAITEKEIIKHAKKNYKFLVDTEEDETGVAAIPPEEAEPVIVEM
jgi:isochorismate synthase EntC